MSKEEPKNLTEETDLVYAKDVNWREVGMITVIDNVVAGVPEAIKELARRNREADKEQNDK